MKSFANQLSSQEIRAVALFVYEQFVQNKKPNTHYHTVENGWLDHQRYQAAFPFVNGELSINKSDLSEEQQQGLQLFLRACVSCHEQAQTPLIFEKRPLSYPRNQFDFKTQLDAVSSASLYSRHDIPAPLAVDADVNLLKGKKLYEDNCSFCHAKDGTGKNWIGQFIQPKARNLQDQQFLRKLSKNELHQRISNGVVGTAMPSWKHVLSSEEITLIVDYILKDLNKKN